MAYRNKNNRYTSRKQKESILVASTLGMLIIIILAIVISLIGEKSQVYYIEPIVSGRRQLPSVKKKVAIWHPFLLKRKMRHYMNL